MKKKTNLLTKKQIILLAKKYNLMPILYDLDKMMTGEDIKYINGAVELLQRISDKDKCIKPTNKVIEVLKLHKRMRDYIKENKTKEL